MGISFLTKLILRITFFLYIYIKLVDFTNIVYQRDTENIFI